MKINIFLIVGLGNPGQRYQNTRHNLGQTAMNSLCINFGIEKFKTDKRLKAAWLISPASPSLSLSAGRTRQTGGKNILAFPLVYMNESGVAVLNLKKYFKIPTKNILIIHDDIDLKIGTFKISYARGAAGHKGVQSIINHLKTKNFYRLRLGIQPLKGKPKNVDGFVLNKFTQEEQELTQKIIEKALKKIFEGYK